MILPLELMIIISAHSLYDELIYILLSCKRCYNCRELYYILIFRIDENLYIEDLADSSIEELRSITHDAHINDRWFDEYERVGRILYKYNFVFYSDIRTHQCYNLNERRCKCTKAPFFSDEEFSGLIKEYEKDFCITVSNETDICYRYYASKRMKSQIFQLCINDERDIYYIDDGIGRKIIYTAKIHKKNGEKDTDFEFTHLSINLSKININTLLFIIDNYIELDKENISYTLIWLIKRIDLDQFIEIFNKYRNITLYDNFFIESIKYGKISILNFLLSTISDDIILYKSKWKRFEQEYETLTKIELYNKVLRICLLSRNKHQYKVLKYLLTLDIEISEKHVLISVGSPFLVFKLTRDNYNGENPIYRRGLDYLYHM